MNYRNTSPKEWNKENSMKNLSPSCMQNLVDEISHTTNINLDTVKSIKYLQQEK